MRLFPLLSILGLLGIRAPSHDSVEPATHRLGVSSLMDTWVSMDTEIVVPDLLGIRTAVGVIGKSIFSSSSTCQKSSLCP